MRAAFKWRITNAKYAYIIDEANKEPFIYDRSTNLRITYSEMFEMEEMEDDNAYDPNFTGTTDDLEVLLGLTNLENHSNNYSQEDIDNAEMDANGDFGGVTNETDSSFNEEKVDSNLSDNDVNNSDIQSKDVDYSGEATTGDTLYDEVTYDGEPEENIIALNVRYMTYSEYETHFQNMLDMIKNDVDGQYLNLMEASYYYNLDNDTCVEEEDEGIVINTHATTYTLNCTEDAYVEVEQKGTDDNKLVEFKFGIPRGCKGDKGDIGPNFPLINAYGDTGLNSGNIVFVHKSDIEKPIDKADDVRWNVARNIEFKDRVLSIPTLSIVGKYSSNDEWKDDNNKPFPTDENGNRNDLNSRNIHNGTGHYLSLIGYDWFGYNSKTAELQTSGLSEDELKLYFDRCYTNNPSYKDDNDKLDAKWEELTSSEEKISGETRYMLSKAEIGRYLFQSNYDGSNIKITSSGATFDKDVTIASTLEIRNNHQCRLHEKRTPALNVSGDTTISGTLRVQNTGTSALNVSGDTTISGTLRVFNAGNNDHITANVPIYTHDIHVDPTIGDNHKIYTRHICATKEKGYDGNYDSSTTELLTISGPTKIIGDIGIDGYVRSTKTMTASAFYTTSDKNKKNILGDLDVDIEKLLDLSLVYFTFKDDEKKKKEIGVIAQEIQEICPEIVSEDENGVLGVDYSKLSVICLYAIKDLYKKLK